MRTNTNIKAVLFDLDGVLVETKTVHFDALNQALADHGFAPITRAEHLHHYDGLKTTEKLARLTRDKNVPLEAHARIWQRKQQLTADALAAAAAVHKNDTVRDTLTALQSQGLRLACCSNSIRPTVEAVLDRLGVSFDVVLTNEDVANGKPHPEIYWNAMAALGVLPEETLVVEDSPDGLAAAYRSGAHVLRVASPRDLTPALLADRIHTLDMSPPRQPRWQHPRLNVIIPMAGAGSRFERAGYQLPKPLIDVRGKPMIQVVVENLALEARFIFVVQKAHRAAYHLDGLLQRIAPGCVVVETDGLTEGAACTALLAEPYIDNDAPLFFANSDQFVEWQAVDFMYKMQESDVDGGIVVFHATDPKWSFARTDDIGVVTQVAEKQPISDLATVGYYYWKRGADFVRYAKQMIARNKRVNNEFYVCPVFNEAIEDGKVLTTFPVQRMWGLGTPEDLEIFLEKYGK